MINNSTHQIFWYSMTMRNYSWSVSLRWRAFGNEGCRWFGYGIPNIVCCLYLSIPFVNLDFQTNYFCLQFPQNLSFADQILFWKIYVAECVSSRTGIRTCTNAVPMLVHVLVLNPTCSVLNWIALAWCLFFFVLKGFYQIWFLVIHQSHSR